MVPSGGEQEIQTSFRRHGLQLIVLTIGIVLTQKKNNLSSLENFHLCQIGLYSFVSILSLVLLSFPFGAVSFGQTIDVQRGASLFRRACIGCHDAGGNIIQPVIITLLMQSR